MADHKEAPEPTPRASAKTLKRLVPKWNVEEWRLFFNGFQALGAVAVASLAIYGVFFTSIPETIVRQLRADAADAREELVGLRAERNRLTASLDVLNSKFSEASEKSKQADARLVEATERLNAVSTELANSQRQLSEEQKAIAEVRSEADALRAASEAAKARLEQLQVSIAKLSADRERYLKVAKLSDFSVLRAKLEKSLGDYRSAVTTALDYLDAPQWDADQKAWADGKRVTPPPELWERSSRATAMLRRKWTREVEADPNNRDALPDKIGKTFQETATYDLERVDKLRLLTGRALIAELMAAVASLTPADFATYRQSATRLMQSIPGLDGQLRVQTDAIRQRGDIATREIARAQTSIAAVELFIERLQVELGR